MAKKEKEDKYQIICNRQQLQIISRAIESYSRRFAGQLDTFHDVVVDDLLTEQLIAIGKEDISEEERSKKYNEFFQRKEEVNDILNRLKAILFPEMPMSGMAYGYNHNPTIGNSYQIYRTIEWVFALERKKNDPHGFSCYDSPPLPSGDLGTITVQKIKESKNERKSRNN